MDVLALRGTPTTTPADRIEIRGETFREAINRLIVSNEDVLSELAVVSETYNQALEAAVQSGSLDLSLYDLP